MHDRESTIRSRELGRRLAEAMRAAGMTGADMARALRWSPGRVSRLLSGKRGGTSTDVAKFLGVCRADDDEMNRLLRIAEGMKTPGWLQRFSKSLPEQLRTLVDLEGEANAIREFQPVMIPGLLQTSEYANALIRETGNVSEPNIAERVAARMARQELFNRPRCPYATYYLHEFVLHLPVGGARVMSEQLHRLLQLSVRQHIELRVVPAAAGGHPAITGQFMLLEFPEFRPAVYLDSEVSCLFLEEPEEIAAYRSILSRLADTALDEGQSRALIAATATRLYPIEEDEDAYP